MGTLRAVGIDGVFELVGDSLVITTGRWPWRRWRREEDLGDIRRVMLHPASGGDLGFLQFEVPPRPSLLRAPDAVRDVTLSFSQTQAAAFEELAAEVERRTGRGPGHKRPTTLAARLSGLEAEWRLGAQPGRGAPWHRAVVRPDVSPGRPPAPAVA